MEERNHKMLKGGSLQAKRANSTACVGEGLATSKISKEANVSEVQKLWE